MDLALINKIMVVLINIIGIWLSLIIYFASRKEKINQFFSLVIIIFLLWINFEFVCSLAPFLGPAKYRLSLFTISKRLAYGFLSLGFIFAYFFSLYFPTRGKRNYFFERIYVSIWLILFFLSIFTSLIIKGGEWKGIEIERITDKGIVVFYLWVLFSIFVILYNIFKKYRLLKEEEKLRVKYFLVGLFFLAFVNILCNIILPIGGIYQFHQFGHYALIFLFGFTAYAIVTKELFGIKIVLTNLLVGLIAILLVLDFLVFTKEFPLRVMKGSFLVAFLYLGYLLTRSILKEIELRKELQKSKAILEEKVKEKTRELEEARLVLEIKVKARTRELEELTKNQEEIIKERTKKLQAKLEELKKFQRLTVGRELKMIELKKEIKELKKEIKELKEKLS